MFGREPWLYATNTLRGIESVVLFNIQRRAEKRGRLSIVIGMFDNTDGTHIQNAMDNASQAIVLS